MKIKKKASALLKQVVAMLTSIAKAKSLAIKNKTTAFKTRLLMLSLVKHKKLMFGSISNKIHSLLGHPDHDCGRDCNSEDKGKAIILYDTAPRSTNGVDGYDDEEEDDKYPDLRHRLFEEEDEFGDLDEVDQKGGSIIEMVKNSKEGGGESFSLEDEIDHVADLFITRFHKQMRLQKLLSFKRYQEMLARGV